MNPEHKSFDPCGVCLEIIESVFEPLQEDEIDRLVKSEWEEFFSEPEKVLDNPD